MLRRHLQRSELLAEAQGVARTLGDDVASCGAMAGQRRGAKAEAEVMDPRLKTPEIRGPSQEKNASLRWY